MKLADTFKALANDTRLQILEWLREPEKNFPPPKIGDIHIDGVCVNDIHKKAGLSQSTVSQYLSILQKAGLVIANRQGQWTYYKRNEDGIKALAQAINQDL